MVPAKQRTSFFDDLQQIMDKIPSREQYVILGDFNARVGSRENEDNQWGRVYGPHELGALNEAGRELLSFLAIILCATHGFGKRKYTSKLGSIPHQGSGTASIML